MFFINVPIVLLAAWALHKFVPVIAPKNPAAKFDGVGVTLLIAASSTIVYGIVQASEAGMFMNSTTMGWLESDHSWQVLMLFMRYVGQISQ
ncbi:hypothetical protein [Weissella cibaria]|uniref:hypothetical protein n=1 Tax=Weissella cibaria TaxID=137591 RepID=UPI001FD68594|nr:hypothetical protein [Weissella cibaria]